ncbi:hypothetical protein BN1708_002699, partial [Verticillium longisporum]
MWSPLCPFFALLPDDEDDDLSLALGPPLAENGAADPNFIAAHGDGALKVVAHAHAQLELPFQSEFLAHEIPLLLESEEVFILRLGRRRLAPRNGTNGHEAEQVQRRALVFDGAAESDRLVAGRGAGLGLLAGRVDLDVDVELVDALPAGQQVGARTVQQPRLLQRVDARDAEEVGDVGELLGVARLQAADEVPAQRAGQEVDLLDELLGVVFAKVHDRSVAVQGEYVVGGLELGDGHEPDGAALGCGCEAGCDGFELGRESLGSRGVDLHLGLVWHILRGMLSSFG